MRTEAIYSELAIAESQPPSLAFDRLRSRQWNRKAL